MENTEIMNNQEIEVVDNYEVMEAQPEETSGKGLIGIALGAVVAGVGILLYKRSKKAEKRKVEKLRKKGYVIYTPEEVEKDFEEDEVEYVETAENTAN